MIWTQILVYQDCASLNNGNPKGSSPYMYAIVLNISCYKCIILFSSSKECSRHYKYMLRKIHTLLQTVDFKFYFHLHHNIHRGKIFSFRHFFFLTFKKIFTLDRNNNRGEMLHAHFCFLKFLNLNKIIFYHNPNLKLWGDFPLKETLWIPAYIRHFYCEISSFIPTIFKILALKINVMLKNIVFLIKWILTIIFKPSFSIYYISIFKS